MRRAIIVTGATGTGKTAYALQLARELGAIVINADSRQIYREIPILSNQFANSAILLQGHHSIKNHYSVSIWIQELRDILNRYPQIPILVGGSYMYIDNLIYGLSKIPTPPDNLLLKYYNIGKIKGISYLNALHKNEKLHQDLNRAARSAAILEATGRSLREWQRNTRQQPFQDMIFDTIILTEPRQTLYATINKRFLQMINKGLLAEICNLTKTIEIDSCKKCCGMMSLIEYIKGNISLDKALASGMLETRRYAKRQISWFKNHTYTNAYYVNVQMIKRSMDLIIAKYLDKE